MNWVGDLVQKELLWSHTVVDLGCGIMQATLDVVPTYPKTKLDCKHVVGVEIHQPYLSFLQELQYSYLHVLRSDVSKGLPFHDKTFDVALLLDILEHLRFEDAVALIVEAERIARRKLIVLTPSVFFSNVKAVKNSYKMGRNIHNQHLCLITRGFLQNQGFDTALPKTDDIHKHYFAVKVLK